MPYVTVGKENGTNIDIYYKDWGKGQPIVFSHGWPLSADDWDAQMMFFLGRGYRVIAHDRRGHGRSAQVPNGAPYGKQRRKWVYGKTREDVHGRWLKLDDAARRGPGAVTE